jgi:hypothetical protein
MNDAVFDALFASSLQPSDTPTAETVAAAIGNTVRNLGTVGCACRVAEEFGDHPEEAADRMRWIRQLASDLCACMYLPTAAPATPASARADMLPVRETG